MIWVWKISPKNVNFFPSDKKISLGRVKKVPRSKAGWPLFTAGQKNSWVRLGQGPSLDQTQVQIQTQLSKGLTRVISNSKGLYMGMNF